MADKGAFNEVDMAMMVHPGTFDSSITKSIACQTLDVEFFGKAAHAAAQPDAGINALEAMISSFTAINSLRQHISDSSRIHGIITDGGDAANIVPAHSAAIFKVRAEDDSYLEELKKKVLNCFIGAATTTGARLKYQWADMRYATMRNNKTLAGLFSQNFRYLGRFEHPISHKIPFGSTDMGNISHLIPCIHALISIAPKGIANHSIEFAEAAASKEGIEALIDAAKSMAMTAVDLVTTPNIVKQVKGEFAEGEQAI
jgi:metal-dependent amidase/aminoacylase/carboxypeptidase family protein